MIIGRQQVKWVWATTLAAVVTSAAYLIYCLKAPNGPLGGSVMGLWFASAGTLIILFECLLGLRKRYRASALGLVKIWLSAHVWLGLLSFLFILMHSGFRWGHGLAAALMWLFLIVWVSGIFGVLLQNYLPRLMTELVLHETIFEQIPVVILNLLAEADERIEVITGDLDLKGQDNAKREKEMAAELAAPQIQIEPDAREWFTEFYRQEIRPYLRERPPALPLRRFRTPELIKTCFDHLRTTMPLATHAVLRDIEGICEERRQLLVQTKLHWWLHGWLWVHVPLSLSLPVLTGVHAVLSLRY